jgi:hypothetical protein
MITNDIDGANGLAAAKLKAIAYEGKMVTKLRSMKMVIV